jgi:hypothetical protein
MKINAPHWLTIVFGAVGACAGALAPVFPNYASIFGIMAGVCAALATPNLVAAPKEPS